MNILCVETLKFVPGSWKQATRLLKKFEAVDKRHGLPKTLTYVSLAGGETMHTLTLVTEWKSLAAMETAENKLLADKSAQKLIEQFSAIVESYERCLMQQMTEKDFA